MLRLNVGSGQRPFAVWRDEHRAMDTSLPCEVCGNGMDEGCFGSGHRYVPQGEWVNVDTNPRWNPDVIADGADMPMFADGSAELIVLHHCAEHFTLSGSQALFAECNRILAPGGSLLVFVPDLNALVRAWIEGKISDYILCVNLHGAYMDDDADIHKWSFTRKTLSEHLKTSRWDTVKPFDWREIPAASIAKDWWILAAEAVK